MRGGRLYAGPVLALCGLTISPSPAIVPTGDTVTVSDDRLWAEDRASRTGSLPRKAPRMSQVETAVQYAVSQVGKPYRWAKPPRTESQPQYIQSVGYDCSGLTWAAYRAAGVKIGYVTYTQIKDGVPVSREQLQRGDLVFPDPGHVQIYLGGGKVVESPTFGKNVQINDLYAFYAARRVASGGQLSDVAQPSTSNGSGLAGAVNVLTDKKNWLRIYMVVFGIALLALALIPLIRETGVLSEA